MSQRLSLTRSTSRRSDPPPPPSRRPSSAASAAARARGVQAAIEQRSQRSITSSEALGKLRQLEAMLENEREARIAAERTVRTLSEARRDRDQAVRDKQHAQVHLRHVLGTLRDLALTLGGEGVPLPRAPRPASAGAGSGRAPPAARSHGAVVVPYRWGTRPKSAAARPVGAHGAQPAAGGSFLDAIGGDTLDMAGKSIRTGYCVDHKGLVHFKGTEPLPGDEYDHDEDDDGAPAPG